MGGIGERLEPVPTLPACGIALVNPGTALATADVFRGHGGAWSARVELPTAWRNAGEMAGDLKGQRNDLQPAAIALRPVIGEVLSSLEAAPGCLLARMSGSGATCFGLFADARRGKAGCGGAATPGMVVLGRESASRPSRLYVRQHATYSPPCWMGRSQGVRQRILIPPFGGSNPPAPASAGSGFALRPQGVQRRVARAALDRTACSGPARREARNGRPPGRRCR